MSARTHPHTHTLPLRAAPIKIFGDLHGQFGDLMRLFEEYGTPSTAGDITYIDYLFLGRTERVCLCVCAVCMCGPQQPRSVHACDRGIHNTCKYPRMPV